jgi:hypothetical protein
VAWGRTGPGADWPGGGVASVRHIITYINRHGPCGAEGRTGLGADWPLSVTSLRTLIDTALVGRRVGGQVGVLMNGVQLCSRFGEWTSHSLVGAFIRFHCKVPWPDCCSYSREVSSRPGVPSSVPV